MLVKLRALNALLFSIVLVIAVIKQKISFLINIKAALKKINTSLIKMFILLTKYSIYIYYN